MELESSLSCPQEPATCPCPDAEESSLYPYILFPQDPTKYYPPIYA